MNRGSYDFVPYTWAYEFILAFCAMYRFPMSLLSFQFTPVLLVHAFASSNLPYQKPYRNPQNIRKYPANAVDFFPPTSAMLQYMHLLLPFPF